MEESSQEKDQPKKKHTLLKIVGLAIAAATVYVTKKFMKSPKKNGGSEEEKPQQ